jgi:ribosomal subunit interface protein
MTISVTGKHMEVGESLAAFTHESIKNIVERYMGNILEATATYSKDHHEFHVDVQVHISHHFVVHCHGKDEDAYKALTHALEKLGNRIKKYKDRLKNHKRLDEKADFTEGSKYLIASSEEDAGKDVPVTIAELNTPIETLTVGEAVMRLEVTNYPVLVFKNTAQNRINVVYNRPDGNIGWIDPK